ncbi:TetR/AcrR family transcriptional regulator C-terminal domain-containing protein [Nocardia cyriacigeorgica]|jgi:TetR/AcrR family transcriptional regulator, tetracycline repressor protein|uniref:mycofactocin system transcriptional regulator MftR2 n=2 Tax=Nocardia cyriacigeorgica TaxID=135487 RepID=UPI000CE9D3FB|nr:mycofactocin system transcriptional regulator MftR2 [Nocardia cyriacigeorgica]AVH22083.1 TetR family transcriptional regulator [Nocardia cyriacigeorgica]MBF6085402.1 TetR/AcrR family transcriptional regulator C-terminal domain-containing protein [Nocardia cyriacigeorgica]MBF6091489.1 TetR/AcrR family transcriptional regulator C-terminal domain-containing protein [Nocardia cyriacigeorgica]MBF6321641.1 TetR/AcrR family transcriptional regulator C-terminal domain-containing protein [Nocardia cy
MGVGRTQASGGGNTLSEAEIVEAALRVVRADGVDKLSMRRLSRELGVSPMAPYYYVADKRELLDLVATAALAGVRKPPPESGPWQQRLRELIDQIDEKLRKHPGLGDVLIEQMLGKQLDIIAAVMEILFDAGFSDRNVLAAYATIHTFLFGRSRVNPRDRSVLTDVTLPDAVARATKYMPDLRGKYSYDFGMGVLIAGLEAQLVQQPDSDVR